MCLTCRALAMKKEQLGATATQSTPHKLQLVGYLQIKYIEFINFIL